MNKKIIKLEPKLVYRLWGNELLNKTFNNYEINNPGEAWVVSAIDGTQSNVESENKMLLSDFFKQNKNFFNNYSSSNYPLLTKIISTSDDLSIQIHPGNNYAKKFNSYGKTECWYILDSKDGYIYLDQDKYLKEEDKIEFIKQNKCLDILDKIDVKPGEFYFIPAQKIHAIGKNVVLFELQQSSDITFRIDDFNRIDKSTNKLRQLHVNDAILALKSDENEIISKQENLDENNQILTNNDYFTLHKITNEGLNTYEFKNAMWLQVYVILGNGKIDNLKIIENDSFLMSSDYLKFNLSGCVTLMVSYVKKVIK